MDVQSQSLSGDTEDMIVRLLTLFLLYVMALANQELEAHITTKMKHLMDQFSKDGNKHPLSDILVFVHSNYGAPLEQVKRYYHMMRGVFPRMIIFGEWDHQTVHDFHGHGLPVFKCPPNQHGSLAYDIMLKALEHFQHPFFKGYMYIHDDLIISPKSILELDKNKLWISDKMERAVLEPWNSRSFGWFFWNTGSGVSAMQAVYDAHPEVEGIMANCTDSKKTGVPVMGTSHILYNGHSDFFYIPVRLLPAYKKYMTWFAEKGVFLEIAVATWAKCFSGNFDTEAIELPICTTWDYSVRSEIAKWGPKCPNDTVIIHPVKHSNEVAVKFAQDFLVKHRTKYSNFTMRF